MALGPRFRGDERERTGTVTFDSVAIVLTDGRKVAISELGPTEEMRREIMGGCAKLRWELAFSAR